MDLQIKAISYFRSGLLLHGITILEVLVLIVFGPRLLVFETGSLIRIASNLLMLGFLSSLPVLSQLDARCRYQNYRRIKDQFARFGFDYRILKPFLKSRCQRDAAWVAANELGYGQLCSDYYFSQGYRWYHITPDFLFSNPGFLITRHFWKSTFLLKTYRPKVIPVD